MCFRVITSWTNSDSIGRADSPCWSYAIDLHRNTAIGRNSWSNSSKHNSANKCVTAQIVLWDSKWYSDDRIAIAYACVDHSQWFLAATATEESKTATEEASWRSFHSFTVVHGNGGFNAKTRFRSLIFLNKRDYVSEKVFWHHGIFFRWSWTIQQPDPGVRGLLARSPKDIQILENIIFR